jgi:hypothetical protein
LNNIQPEIVNKILKGVRDVGGLATWVPETRMICINDELLVAVMVARSSVRFGQPNWECNLARFPNADLTVLVRMDLTNSTPMDYYIVPRLDRPKRLIRFRHLNRTALDVHRFDTLEPLIALAARDKIVAGHA